MKITLVGAGPGDPGLLTLRGRDALSLADVIIYDALANAALLDYARPGAELIYVGKVADKHALPQDQINALLVQKAKEGKIVVRLKGGDPYVFGRGGEEAEYAAEHGVPFEEVPGISSAVAAPAYAGIPLTHRDFVSAVTIITGHEKPGKECPARNWQAYAASGATLVFLMGMRNLAHICSSLMDAGMAHDMPAAIIYKGTTPKQRVLVSTVKDLPAAAAAANFTNPSVIVAGEVASLADKLGWFSAKPLLGRTIVVTRAREQASGIAAQLADLGADVIQCPSIAIKPVNDYSVCDDAIGRLCDYRWVIFTSVNGVKYFWQRLERAGLDSRALGHVKVAAIGPATASAVAGHGIKADLVPPTYVAESVAQAMKELDGEELTGRRILLPRADKARNVLPEELARAGAKVDVAPMYETVPDTRELGAVREALAKGELSCITFGSSSTVDNFLNMLPAEELKAHPEVLLAAIGPVTAATLAKYGLKAAIQPEEFTIPGMIEAIVEYYRSRQ